MPSAQLSGPRPTPGFIYLVMTPGRLPPAVDRDLVRAGRDVLVLSYERAVDGQLFLPFSTWTEGRNRLILAARERAFDYLVVLDDDVRLEITPLAPRWTRGPWDLLEHLVSAQTPAVAVPDYPCDWYPPAVRDVEGIYSFDACLNVFHRDAVDALLPYHDALDHLSWHFSQAHLVHLAALLYDGCVVRLNSLRAVNTRSRPYRRGRHGDVMNRPVRESIRSEQHRARFRPLHLPQDGNSTPLSTQRPHSYRYDRRQLAHIFDLQAPLWRRREEILAGGARPAPRAGRSRMATWGEVIHRRLGPRLTNRLFAAPIVVRALYMRVRHTETLEYRLKQAAFRLSPRLYLRLRTVIGRTWRHPFQRDETSH